MITNLRMEIFEALVLVRPLMPAPAPLLSALLSPTDGGERRAPGDTQTQGTRRPATSELNIAFRVSSHRSSFLLRSAPRLLRDSCLSPCVTNKLNLAEWRTLNVVLLT